MDKNVVTNVTNIFDVFKTKIDSFKMTQLGMVIYENISETVQ